MCTFAMPPLVAQASSMFQTDRRRGIEGRTGSIARRRRPRRAPRSRTRPAPPRPGRRPPAPLPPPGRPVGHDRDGRQRAAERQTMPRCQNSPLNATGTPSPSLPGAAARRSPASTAWIGASRTCHGVPPPRPTSSACCITDSGQPVSQFCISARSPARARPADQHLPCHRMNITALAAEIRAPAGRGLPLRTRAGLLLRRPRVRRRSGETSGL